MQAPTLTAVVVLPTPPFWLATAYTVPIACKLAERALARRSRASREARGRRRHLLEHVEVAVAGARKRLYRADLPQAETELLGSRPGAPLLRGLATPAPVGER